MHVWLVRHALAADREKFRGPDTERPLTDKGRRRFRRFSRWLLEQTAPPDLILSSPLLRTAQTAQILAKSCGLKRAGLQYTDLLAPGTDPREVLSFLCDRAVERVALVGHEPDLGTMLSLLIGGGSIPFGKGFVAAVEFHSLPPAGDGQLLWFVGPKFA